MRKFLFLLPFLLLSIQSVHAYELKGQVKLTEDWQPRVYLASIQSPENLFVASPDFVINEAFVDPDGNFTLSGNDLPDDLRFYRLYFVRNNSLAIEFTNDYQRNFIHLLLDNSTQLMVTDTGGGELFDHVKIEGSEANTILSGFEQSYFQKRIKLNEINTIAKRDFQSQSLNRSIRDFVVKCEDPMVGLFAVYHIDDRETDFLRNANFYFDFQERMKAAYPKALYTAAYDDLLNSLVGYRDLVCEIPKITKPWRTWIIWAQSILIIALLLWIWKLKNRKEVEEKIDYGQLLTEKERKIWESLAAGKTNKEIAADLFIELSTVKTHINNLYKRLGVANRKEAILLFNSQK